MTTKRKKINAWFLFDSEESCAAQSAANFPDFFDKYISIGISRDNKDSKKFINFDLSDHSQIFDNVSLAQKLVDKIGWKCDLLVSNPPCETFSRATSVRNETGGKGNANWQITPHKFSENITFSLQDPQAKLYGGGKCTKDIKQFYQRINGEACWRNTWEIIREINPRFYLVEQPDNLAIPYFRKFIEPPKSGVYAKKVYYSAYNPFDFSPKREVIFSNVDLKLKTEKIIKTGNTIYAATDENKERSKNYGTKSSVPIELLDDCFSQFKKIWEQE